jgi:hypothetical protein
LSFSKKFKEVNPLLSGGKLSFLFHETEIQRRRKTQKSKKMKFQLKQLIGANIECTYEVGNQHF